MSFSTCSQGQIPFCYTDQRVNAGATYSCCATRRHVVTPSTYESICLVEFICAGAVYYNPLTNRAALSCRTQRRLNHMCSRTVSDTAYRFRHGSTLCSPTVEKILCRPPDRSGRRSLVCARLRNKGNGIHKGGNLGVHPCARRRRCGGSLSQRSVLILNPSATR